MSILKRRRTAGLSDGGRLGKQINRESEGEIEYHLSFF